jgi:hypothetical protein
MRSAPSVHNARSPVAHARFQLADNRARLAAVRLSRSATDVAPTAKTSSRRSATRSSLLILLSSQESNVGLAISLISRLLPPNARTFRLGDLAAVFSMYCAARSQSQNEACLPIPEARVHLCRKSSSVLPERPLRSPVTRLRAVYDLVKGDAAENWTSCHANRDL